MDGFLNPKEESENLQRAREQLSESSLPISFENTEDDQTSDETNEEEDVASDGISALIQAGSIQLLDGPNEELLQNNPFLKVVSKLSPSELISKFMANSHPRVQNAVRTTILGLIGNLPKMAFDTTTITTGERLASLMFQLQMTGYMFKNAEYRLSLSQSLGMTNGATFGQSSDLLLTGSEEFEDDDEERDPLQGKVKGKLKIKYESPSMEDSNATSSSEASPEIEVDAAAYLSELRSEVSRLRDDLTQTRQAKEEAVRKDLLMYIRTLPQQELQSLTNTISPDVLVSMKGLVNVVMAGIGEGKIEADTVTEQSGEAMAQLCMWQLVVGYNLREMEVREEMKKSLSSRFSEEGGVDFGGVEPGALD